jgi:hypothetical protein
VGKRVTQGQKAVQYTALSREMMEFENELAISGVMERLERTTEGIKKEKEEEKKR